MVEGTECVLAESTMSGKPRPSKCRTNDRALSTSFSGCVRSSRASTAGSREPAFTPIRMGMPASPAASITASTLAHDPMLPGLIRRAEAPRAHAPRASRWSKWMSATTGSGLSAQTSPKPSRASADGTATRTISQPSSARAATWASVAAGSWVGVQVMDWTATGAPPPTATGPTWTRRVRVRGRGPGAPSPRSPASRRRSSMVSLPRRSGRCPAGAGRRTGA